MSVSTFAPGSYRYIDGVFQYSGGVAALPGSSIVRVQFHRPVPLEAGFHRIADIITGAGRPMTAFCACELRSPKPFTEAGFAAFNESYVVPLRAWGLIEGERNPVARSNVCPAVDPPEVPSFHAFCYTVPHDATLPSFVISGSAEAAEGGTTYRIIRPGETGPEALREKALFVLGVIESRMDALGHDWPATTATQVYTVQDFHPFVADELVRRGAARAGLTWHYNRPPVAGLEYEMDTRAVTEEHVSA